MTALLLLAPGTPMLFQGQEFASSRPFRYFADQGPGKGRDRGRPREVPGPVSQFALRRMSQACLSILPTRTPSSGCKLDFSERVSHGGIYALHRDLLRLRREDRVFSQQRRGGWTERSWEPRPLCCVTLGGRQRPIADRQFWHRSAPQPGPEPLLAPPEGCRWQLLWSSEDPGLRRFREPPLETEANWRIPGNAAVVMIPDRVQQSANS